MFLCVCLFVCFSFKMFYFFSLLLSTRNTRQSRRFGRGRVFFWLEMKEKKEERKKRKKKERKERKKKEKKEKRKKRKERVNIKKIKARK